MDTTVIHPSVHYFGTPVVLVTTLAGDGSTNITPVSSSWALADRYVVGMLRENQGAVNLERTGQAVLNLPDAGLVDAVESLALTTASDPVPAVKAGFRTVRDKWAHSGLTPMPSQVVTPARVSQCPVQIECTLDARHDLGDGLSAYQLRVRRVHAHVDHVVPGTDHVDLDRWRPLLYTFRHYFAQGPRVGVCVRAEQ